MEQAGGHGAIGAVDIDAGIFQQRVDGQDVVGQDLGGLAPHHEDTAAHQLGGIAGADFRRIGGEGSRRGEEEQAGGDRHQRQYQTGDDPKELPHRHFPIRRAAH